MANPVFTVCLPTIGRTAFLEETIRSIERQSFQEYETLVLDNASDPEAAGMLASYAARDSRVRLLRSDERLHMFDNFARGIVAARGELLAFCHDDDVYDPLFLERHASLMRSDARIAFSGSNCRVIDERSRITGTRRLVSETGVWEGERFIATLFRLGVNVVPMQSIAFRRDVLGPRTFDRSVDVNFSDYVILMRLAEGRRVGLIETPLVSVREHTAQATFSIPRGDAILLRDRVLREYCDDYEQRRPGDKPYVDELREALRRARLSGLLWGWLSGGTDADARSCIAALRASGRERLLARVLGALDVVVPPRARKGVRTGPVRRLTHAFMRRSVGGAAGRGNQIERVSSSGAGS